MKAAPAQGAARSEALYFKLALLALAALPLLLFAPALFGGKMLWGGDIQTIALPFDLSARRNLAAGQLPLWMPELFGGMPGIAATNLIFLYPSETLIQLLKIPVPQGIALDAALQVALAGIGMLLFCRRLGASLQASFLAAFAFALSGSQLSILFAGHVNNIKAIALIPWAFWAAHKALKQRSFFDWGLCGLVLALQMLAIGMQIFAYTAIGLAAYAAWWALGAKDGPEAPARPWAKANPWVFAALGLGLSMAFMFLISAPQLWLSLRYKPYSWREGFSYEQFTTWSFPPKEALGWLVPGFFGWREPTYHGDWQFCLSSEYMGILPWALAFSAAAALWRVRQGAARFLWGFAALSFLAAAGAFHHVFFHLPVYSGFRAWTRFLTLLTFCICALSALGWDALFSPQRAGQAVKAALGFCALALVVALACLGSAGGEAASASAALAAKLGGADAARGQVVDLIQSSAGRTAALALTLGALFWALPRRSMMSLAFALALGLQAWDISDMAGRYLQFRNPSDFLTRPAALNALPDPAASPEPFRILETPGVWGQNAGMIFGYESLLGYHGVQLAGPMKIQNAMQGRQMDWLSLMNVRYILSRQPLQGLPLLQDGDIKVYSNPSALPRAWLVRSALKAGGQDEAYAMLGQASFHPSEQVILEQGQEWGASGKGSPGSVQWLKRSPNSFDLKVEAAQSEALVISQNWYPDWRCEVDGQKAGILRADGGLQAVLLAAGPHQLHFYCSAALLGWAALASALGLAFLLLLGLARRRGLGWA